MLIHYLLFILMMISFLIIFSKPTSFKQESPYEIVPYSEEYIPLYELTHLPERYDHELQCVTQRMSPSSHVLDVGSGLGVHVHQLHESGISAVGLDSSKAMVKHAKRYPCSFIHGNVMTTSLFPEHSFTHMLCLYYTIYDIHDKETFLNNAHHWLMEDGLLYIHGVNEWSYREPMVGDIVYESSLHNSMLKEKIIYHKRTYHIHHIIYFISKQNLLRLAHTCHFSLVQEHTYFNHYILVLKREPTLLSD